MLKENPKSRPNIYQVLREACLMQGIEVPIKDVCPPYLPPRSKLIMVDIRRKNTVGVKAKPTITQSRSHHQRTIHSRGRLLSAASTAAGNTRCGAYAERETDGQHTGALGKTKPIANAWYCQRPLCRFGCKTRPRNRGRNLKSIPELGSILLAP